MAIKEALGTLPHSSPMRANQEQRRTGRAGWVMALPLILAFLGAISAEAWAVDGKRQGELVRLVREDCGSCHGLTLKGGLGPALLPENLKDKPDESLMLTILQGRLGTPMPPWGPFMSEAEASWIVARLKSGFPEK